jgi:glutaredoxin
LPRRPRSEAFIHRPEVRFYHAPGCHLCDAARTALETVREEVGFELVEVDISDDAALELRYRPWLPVVEIDGERAFYFTVDADELRLRIGTKSATNHGS